MFNKTQEFNNRDNIGGTSMGRPLNDRNFTDTANSGKQLQVTAVLDSGVGAEPCWIMSQKGSRSYIVAAEADSNRYGRVTLQATTPTVVGEATLDVTVYDGVTNTTATATANIVGGTVDSITVTDGGSGYTTAPTVTITGDGTGATATATISGGVVTAITVTNVGTGYTTATVALSAPAAGGAVEKARTVQSHIVKTFEGNEYFWKIGVDADAIGSGGASLQSA